MEWGRVLGANACSISRVISEWERSPNQQEMYQRKRWFYGGEQELCVVSFTGVGVFISISILMSLFISSNLLDMQTLVDICLCSIVHYIFSLFFSFAGYCSHKVEAFHRLVAKGKLAIVDSLKGNFFILICWIC